MVKHLAYKGSSSNWYHCYTDVMHINLAFSFGDKIKITPLSLLLANVTKSRTILR
jgi:hypothetical protein